MVFNFQHFSEPVSHEATIVLLYKIMAYQISFFCCQFKQLNTILNGS